jgi:hypothetical protein
VFLTLRIFGLVAPTQVFSGTHIAFLGTTDGLVGGTAQRERMGDEKGQAWTQGRSGSGRSGVG